MLNVHLLSLLLLAVGSVSASLFAHSPISAPHTNVILPQFLENGQTSIDTRENRILATEATKDMQASLVITSVYNETRGSGFHPFACWEHPDFFSGQRKKWSVGTKQKFELDCWTNAVHQAQSNKIKNTIWTFAQIAFDNEILWFHATRENCWFPDFVVQKDALYGPYFGNTPMAPATTAAPVAAAAAKSTGKATAKTTTAAWGPPWMRGGGSWGPPWIAWMQQGGPPWMQWMNSIGGAGPATEDDLRYKLRFCPTPTHQVGSFREQYNGETYCYKATRLDSENRRLTMDSVDRPMELECHTTGNTVELDSIWWKAKTKDDCYIPNQVFDPNLFLGNAGLCVKK